VRVTRFAASRKLLRLGADKVGGSTLSYDDIVLYQSPHFHTSLHVFDAQDLAKPRKAPRIDYAPLFSTKIAIFIISCLSEAAYKSRHNKREGRSSLFSDLLSLRRPDLPVLS
jgi:hypothetical protein